MKKNLLFLMCAVWCVYAGAQSPQVIPYQAVARDASGNLVVNQNICIEFTIHELTATGTIEYQETQTTTTNKLGLFNLAVGASTANVLVGTMAGVNWTGGIKFMEVGYDATGTCSSFISMGASQMMSVPYALYAGSAASSAGPAGGDLTGNYPNPAIGANKVTLADLATLPANTAIGNSTGSAATPAAVPMVSTATASAIGIRDANANMQVNNMNELRSYTTTSATTVTLTVASQHTQAFIGTLNQLIVLPNATTLQSGQAFFITNRSTGTITVETNGGATLQTLPPGSQCLFTAMLVNTAAGTWDVAISYTSPGWSLTGNTISTAGNFVGTTSASTSTYQPLIFETGGTPAGLIDNGYYGQQTFLGTNAGLASINASNPGNNGNDNVGIGTSALAGNTTGQWNTAVGYTALQANTIGIYNTAIGMDAMQSNQGAGSTFNPSGSCNTAVGVQALVYSTGTGSGGAGMGDSNTTVGVQSLYQALGSGNTALGTIAGSTSFTGNDNTFIGFNAQTSAGSINNATAIGCNAKVGASNTLVLGGAATTKYSVLVGIGTTTPTSALQIVQTIATTGTPGIFSVTGAAHTTLTAGTEATDINLNLARTVQFNTGAITTQRAVRFQAPTYAFVGASTITNAATVDISGPPAAGSNATITNPAALLVESGNVGIGTLAPTSTLYVAGSVAANTSIQSGASYNAAATDYCIIFRGSTAQTCTLPVASTCKGRIYSLVNQNTGASTVTISSTSTINGGTTIASATNFLVISDGTAWNKIN